jgi:FkbM family methyltransferase
MLKERVTKVLGEMVLTGRALRWYANQYEDGSVVTIQQGHARSLRWKRHHRYINGYWIGHYEFPIQEALKRSVHIGDCFFDVGANAGFFSLIAARLVGPTGKCVAFDPSPENTTSIAEQIRLNGFRNTTVVAEAVADFEGEADFCFPSPGSPEGHLGSKKDGEQKTRVRVTTLDEAVRRFGAPNFVKMDIEGGENQALRGAESLLREVRPSWLIELHSPACELEVKDRLAAAGYNFFDLDGRRVPLAQTLPGHFVAHPTARE